jgi:hypothetical protein
MILDIEIHDTIDAWGDDAQRLLAYGGYAALKLFAVMSFYSEEIDSAMWLGGLEHYLWEAVSGGEHTFQYGSLTGSAVNEVKRLSEIAGGWICWEDGPRFISMEPWLEKHTAWLASDWLAALAAQRESEERS